MRPATKKATTIAIRTGIMLLPSLLEDAHMPRPEPEFPYETHAPSAH